MLRIFVSTNYNMNMKHLLPVAFLLISTVAIAQPVINRSNLFYAGDEFFATDVSVIPDPGMAGENVTWDFSTIVGDTAIIHASAAIPDTTPFAADYPESNLAVVYSVGGFQAFEYDTISESGYEQLGYVLAGISRETYSDPIMYLQFPFTYQSQWQDTFASVLEYFISPVSIETEGVLNAVVDGYGTLKLPHTTFTNAVRVKIISESTDSSDLGQGLSEKNVNHDTSYVWFSPSYHSILCTYDYTFTERTVYLTTPDTVITDFETEENSSFSYDPMSGNTAISEVVKPGTFALHVSPNPFDESLQLSFSTERSAEMQFELRDMNGNVVRHQMIAAQAGDNNVVVDLPNVIPGPYLVLLTSSTGTDVQKLIRINAR